MYQLVLEISSLIEDTVWRSSKFSFMAFAQIKVVWKGGGGAEGGAFLWKASFDLNSW